MMPRFKPSLSDKLIKRLGRPLTPEEANLLILAEIVLEEEPAEGQANGHPSQTVL